MAAKTKTRTLTLKGIPEDVYVFLIKEQNKIKEQKRVGVFSLERTVYTLLRETDAFKKCKDCN